MPPSLDTGAMPRSMTGRVPVTVIVLTFNEGLNLRACLESVSGWTDALYVVDSGSTDGTLAIAQELGATVIAHPFETHAKQWQWALTQLPTSSGWVLGLDADQRVTEGLRDEITALVTSGTGAQGAYLPRRQVFRGRWIKYGVYYPKYLLKLFRLEAVKLDAGDLVDHHFIVDGPTVNLSHDLIEDNQNEAAIAVWTAKHNRYATQQARQEMANAGGFVPFSAVFGTPDDRTRWMKFVWANLPLFVRPCLYVFYRYVLRLGFLDGKQGFIFHVLQGFWYRLMIDINIDELKATAVKADERREIAKREVV
jgi:glycosyltransferase involved in cell wall biosynthesis